MTKLQDGGTPSVQPTVIDADPLTEMPTISFSPTLKPTSTPVVTKTPTIIAVSTEVTLTGLINKNVNCREGPASYYKTSGIIENGTAVDIIGSDTINNWVYVKITQPSSYETTPTELTCWISKDILTIEEDASNLPFITPIPPYYYVYTLIVSYTKLYKEGIYPLASYG